MIGHRKVVIMSSESSIVLEREATILICSETPEAVYTEIAGLSAIDGYELVPGEPQILEDHYFDTPDGKFRAKKWGLRLRRIGPDFWITLKGPPKQTEWGGRERAEIEARWSDKSLAGIVQELFDLGIETNFQKEALSESDPLPVMMRAGLVIIQRRDTRRAASAVISCEDGKVRAEMAADSVIYYFSEGVIRHYEVEIEAKDPDGSKAAEVLAKYLLARYSPELRRWPHDKLVTGWAVRELLARGSLKGLVHLNNHLKPISYDKIDEYLTHELSL
jgi:hypothetical protein